MLQRSLSAGGRWAWRGGCLLLALAGAIVAASPAGRLPVARLPHPAYREQLAAARLMVRCEAALTGVRQQHGCRSDRSLDPNATGLIGEEFTPLTTSLGELEDKRTAGNPAFAALMVRYFHEAGLKRGDVVAVGASGSFPALVVATLTAAKACGLRPVVIASVGASMYGANLPQLAIPDMLKRLSREQLIDDCLAAVSLGGEGDLGEGVLLGGGAGQLLSAARRSGARLIREATLPASIRRRLDIYASVAGRRPVRCFVNVGGADPNYGGTEASLRFPSGLVVRRPSVAGPGLIFAFAARGVPVINLISVRVLARENGLPFDPIPFPPLGTGPVYSAPLPARGLAVGVLLLALAALAVTEVRWRRAGARFRAQEQAGGGWPGNLG